MSKVMILVVVLVMFGCGPYAPPKKEWTKLGVISDFEIYKSGSFNGYDVAVVTLDDGRKVSVRLAGMSLITGHSLYTGKLFGQTSYQVKP